MEKERISFGSQYKFPLKLYEVANDGLIIKWDDDGMSVTVEQKEFEDNVTAYYPGFVQVKSFHNLRRLFRDYSFTFQVLKRKRPTGLKLQFRHPFFTRDNPHHVLQVRKSKRRYCMHPLATSSPNNKLTRWRRKRASFVMRTQSKFEVCDHNGNISYSSDELDSCTKMVTEHSNSESSWTVKNIGSNKSPIPPEQNCLRNRLPQFNGEVLPASKILTHTFSNFYQPHRHDSVSKKLTDEDMSTLAQIIAKNEMSESEFWELVTRKSGTEWVDKSWDATMTLLNSIVNPELSPLHHPDSYYEFSLDEM